MPHDASVISRIVVVGAGSAGRRHVRIARQLNPNARIQVVRRPGHETVPEHADGCFTDLGAAVGFAPQLAVIAGPATHHVQAARRFAEGGAHLLVEKPLADSPDAVGDLLDVCRSRGCVLVVGYNLRFLPALLHLRKQLLERGVGTVLSVRAEVGQYLPSWRTGSDYRACVSAQRSLGGGPLLELSHEIDYLRWLFGDVNWLLAVLGRFSALEVDTEDSAHLILGFEGLVTTLNIDFIRHDTTRVCTVIGETGSLRLNLRAGTVERFEPNASEWQVVFRETTDPDDTYVAEWRHFMACARGEQAPLISGEDGVAVLRVIAAARESAESGRRVVLKERAT